VTKIYACLIGNWVCLNDDPECVFPDFKKAPYTWWEENAPIYAPSQRTDEMKDCFYYQNYVNIVFKGTKYRINPIFIQAVTE
jgi:hypothetical protein